MIRNWLIKHWWFNEALKLLLAIFFGIVAYSIYFSDTDRCTGFIAGAFTVLSLSILLDMLVVLWNVVRGREPYRR